MSTDALDPLFEAVLNQQPSLVKSALVSLIHLLCHWCVEGVLQVIDH